jgi:hypothetical protein
LLDEIADFFDFNNDFFVETGDFFEVSDDFFDEIDDLLGLSSSFLLELVDFLEEVFDSSDVFFSLCSNLLLFLNSI